jgi:hypothetical protein
MKKSDVDTVKGWFAGRLPDGWFTGAPTVTEAGDQIKVVGTLPDPALPAGVSKGIKAGAEAGRIARFREETRRYRMWIAREAEHRFGVNVQWGATCGGTTQEFNPGGGRGDGRGRGDAAAPQPADLQSI